jgi:ATP-dependent Clp protease adapter protein ClpS
MDASLKMWSLSLRRGDDGTDRKILWNSSLSSLYPSSKEISRLLESENITPDDLTYLSIQIIRHTPSNVISVLLATLACHYYRNTSNVIDVRMLQNIPHANRQTICGLVFKKGDIVWTCRTCAKDPTCVQCDHCFKCSDHKDHEVYFHRASGRGGCCDCGDIEAWSLCGNCTEHTASSQDEIDPLTAVPEGLLKGFKAVVCAAIGIIVSYARNSVYGFESLPEPLKNHFRQKDTQIAIRLHNDDVHTYEEVTSALVSFGIPLANAGIMTAAVDNEGEALVFVGDVSDVKVARAIQILREQAGLLVSIVPDQLRVMGPSVSATFSWLLSFGNSNDGLRRVVTETFIGDPVIDFPTFLSGSIGRDLMFDDILEFNEFDLSIPLLGINLPPRLNQDPSTYVMWTTPFNVCPKNALAVLIMSSPYLNPVLCKVLNDLVIVYQQDQMFKKSFSQIITLLYPALYGLYFRSVGLVKDTIFSTTVQVYTADSIVTMMSSEGVYIYI